MTTIADAGLDSGGGEAPTRRRKTTIAAQLGLTYRVPAEVRTLVTGGHS